jgi:hypothetical protein
MALTNFRNGVSSFGIPLTGGMPPSFYGRYWFVDAKVGSDGNRGNSADRPFQTMDKAFDNIDSGDVIIFRGKIREELTTPAGVFDVTIIGAANQPRHADDHSESSSPGRGSSSATWTTPASPTAATPLLIVQQQGWKFYNFLWDGPSDAAALQLFRDGGADDAERDASHAHILGCKFVAGQNHIEFKGGLSQVVLEENLFFGATADSILETVGAGIGTNNYHRFLNNAWHNNESHIDMAANYATIRGNTFGKKTTDGINLGGGSENVVTLNYLYGTYSIAGGYTAGTNDEWAGNFNSLAGGVTASDPA